MRTQPNRKIDETGLVKVVQNKVTTVMEIITGENYVATEQGKKYKRNKDLKMTSLNLTSDYRNTVPNRRLAKKRVQCLNEALSFVSSSVLADSFVLRNPLLHQAPNR
jgi:hypothetical protein